jgi:hypothetical protein
VRVTKKVDRVEFCYWYLNKFGDARANTMASYATEHKIIRNGMGISAGILSKLMAMDKRFNYKFDGKNNYWYLVS